MEKLWNKEENKLDDLKKELSQLKNNINSTYKNNETINNSRSKEGFEKQVFSKYPRLLYLKNQLFFDQYSNIKNIEPMLHDLSTLPNKTLEKIKKYNNKICISDRSVTIRLSNKDLKWSPRGWPPWSSRADCWWVYRSDQKILYVWRDRVNWNYYYQDLTMLHEMWHMFDYCANQLTRPSQTKEFKKFHKQFYNKLRSYFQQGWPWWKVWCEEFFAEACYEFFRRWENKFVKYYNQDLYNYMKQYLV